MCAVMHRACGSVESRRESLDGVRAGGSRDMSAVRRIDGWLVQPARQVTEALAAAARRVQGAPHALT